MPESLFKVKRLSELAAAGLLKGKRVLIRADLNVPQDDLGNITEDTRIRASVPGIKLALDAGATPGFPGEEASAREHTEVLRNQDSGVGHETPGHDPNKHEAIGTGLGAAVSSFLFFATGALIPVLPFIFGLSGNTAVAIAALLVGVTLIGTGVIVGLLSGAPPLRRALRQLMIGYGAAGITWLLGLLVGGGIG